MYPISPTFEHLLLKRNRQWLSKVEIGDKEYDTDVIVDFEIDTSIVSADDFEIGTVIVPKLVIRLKSFEKLPDNAKVTPYVALSLDQLFWDEVDDAWEDAEYPWSGGVTDWLPLGEYYIDSRQQINNTWEYVCYGKLMLANAAYISSLSYPASMQEIWDELCVFLDYEYDASVIIDPSYTIPVAPTGYSMRQVMGYIAGANGASVYESKDGIIKFKVYEAAEDPVFDITVSDYIRLKQTNPIKLYNRIVGVYDTDDSLSFEAGEGDENHTLTIENPFLTQDIVEDLHAKLDGLMFMPTNLDIRAYPQIDIGDVLGVYRDDSLPWVDTEIEWEDNELPWDGLVKYVTIAMKMKYRFSGGLFMAIESNAHSEQQSEFKVDSSIAAQIKRINQSAVKQGKTYYGVTVSKEFGFRVDRSDGLAHAIWNADEFRFVANGQDALWFDVPSKQFKFSGHLEAASGTFTGTVQAGMFIGGLIYGANISTNLGDYPYCEMSASSNVFKAAKSPFSYIEIEANPASYASPLIKHVDGNLVAFTGSQAGGYFSLVANGNYSIGAQDGTLRLSGKSIILNADTISGIPQSAITGLSGTINTLNLMYQMLDARIAALE